MLKNLDPLLNADLLYALRAMGHGDEIVLVDCNFPAESVASTTVIGEPIRLDGVDMPQLARAVCSVFPFDSYVDAPILRMEVVGAPDEVTEVQQEFKQIVDENSDRDWTMGSLERHEFYERASEAFAIVACNERRPYACLILTKGVIGPDGKVV